MSIVNEHIFYQEFGLHEEDIISLREIYQSGIDIRMPEISSIKYCIELEAIFKNNIEGSLSLFDRIISVKYGSKVSGELARLFTFHGASAYFAFMNELNKLLLLGFYAQCSETTDGNIPDDCIEESGRTVLNDTVVGQHTEGMNEYFTNDTPGDFRKLLDDNEISVRSANVLFNGEIDTITKFIDYYQRNLCFKELRNCGKKSDEELTELARPLLYAAELNYLAGEGNILKVKILTSKDL